MTDGEYQRHIAVRLSSPDQVRDHVLRSVARRSMDERWHLALAGELKHSKLVIADGFIHRNNTNSEIGWGLDPSHWHRGLGRELVAALLALAIEHLDSERVWCKVMSGNAASVSLARRAGFKWAKSSPDYPVGGGRSAAVQFFSMSRECYLHLPY
ncbi:MAG: GNAT family N-acetyltransferase [Pseudomonadota bacterium]|nr:GNAT family N-acetyltransferase [Pseudomonadota bacterium]